ncbi:GFA family protein [Dyella nitratireducens]|uniref:CENP-V/GFA domain-containing protein n=1 Tax=Dyella nitratireducens TaxID=1849580 RepID=A0ABQ1G740_9GAMM|nr:GFA family protein [Dyella nitratireducens]GGA38031.1 hypothetical protein GCM10010981_28980 [Dyella nitratireducens]GLQ40256.1 hypothetical protein GCM10007902_01050 [Dyella nitratireducens]
MTFEGGCYYGAVRYTAEGEPVLKGECYCRECQYISGGAPQLFLVLPLDAFRYTKGTVKTYTRRDLEQPVTREFCPECGTHLVTRRPDMPVVIMKIGTLDDPRQFGAPQVAIFTCDKQPFHQIASGMPAFEKMPVHP